MSETTPRRSEQINELASALAKAQAAMQNPHFDRENTFFNNAPYATLASVRDAVIPALSANNLSILQSPKYFDGLAGCEWILMHSSGQWQCGELLFPIQKKDAQGVGGAVTYARRYTLLAIAGVAGEPDDDGNVASTKFEEPPKTTRTTSRKSTPSDEPPKPSESPPSSFSPEYAELRKVLSDAQCGSPEDAEMFVKFCLSSGSHAKAKKDAKHAKEIMTGVELALAEYKTPAAILAAARNVPQPV